MPLVKHQRCIIHQIRASMKYVASGDQKAFAKDLKSIYAAINEETALNNLLEVKEQWGKKYLPHYLFYDVLVYQIMLLHHLHQIS
ncbi:transposase [Cellulosilyticum ruminicola]|uniref:transposase n=1 Tax=Cellulosilyticum ruminicola TaxID=425254 RepID=UPI00278BF544